jgi:calcineurin-like phosphoesterase family protein
MQDIVTKLKFKDGDKLFFISDLHFYHKNIIDTCKRPFSSVEEMTDKLISNWNEKVPEDGEVFVVGDFCWSGDYNEWKKLLARLNGTKYLVVGNHDCRVDLNKLDENDFKVISFRLEVRVGDNRFELDHFPKPEWTGSYHGVRSLYGHIHNSVCPCPSVSSYNLSVENNDYTPIAYDELMEIFAVQERNNITNASIEYLYH